MKNPWITKSKREIYENPWIQLTEYQVVHPGGKDGIYGLVHFKSIAVGVIPLDEEYHTWIVGQYRYTLKEYSWEIPEGGGKLGIAPLESAKRELLEETGIKAEKWDEVLNLDVSNSVTDERAKVYVARGLSFHEAQPDEDEDLQVKRLPFAEVFQMAMSGKITDAIAVAAILKVQLLIDKGRI